MVKSLLPVNAIKSMFFPIFLAPKIIWVPGFFWKALKRRFMSSGLCCRSPSIKIVMSDASFIDFRVPVSRLLPFPRLILCCSRVTFAKPVFIISAVLSVEPSSTTIIEESCFG